MSSRKMRQGNPKTKSQRLKTVNEVKMKCIDHDLEDELATKILFTMLDNYYNRGTTYIDKKLQLNLKFDINRYYLVNLFNNQQMRDEVVIRADEDSESSVRVPMLTRAIDDFIGTVPDSDSDEASDEAPELVTAEEPVSVKDKNDLYYK